MRYFCGDTAMHSVGINRKVVELEVSGTLETVPEALTVVTQPEIIDPTMCRSTQSM